MPQMAPMNWILLMTMFILLFLMISSLNYFNLKYLPKKKKLLSTKYKIYWKW